MKGILMKTAPTARSFGRTTPLAMLWTAPALAFYGLFALFPLVVAVYLSCLKWNGLNQAVWVGASNWLALLHDGVAGHAIVLTFVLVVFTWAVETPLSILLGVFMAGPQRYRAVLSVFYFVPLLFSTVALGLTWTALLDPNFGALNALLRLIGLSRLAQGWLGDPNLALPVLILLIAWQMIPFHALLYQAGARQIPVELYDAANLDGANRWDTFFHITLPQLRYTVVTSSTLILTGALTSFDLIFVTTGGGPGNTTRVLALDMYITSFQSQQFGYGSVMAVLLVIIGVAMSVVLLRVTKFSQMSSQLEGL
jgi:raffinose/stachyose/melibiose transport system permease protein